MKSIIMITLVLASLGTVTAQTTSWQIDPVHSSISFAVDYMVLTEVTGNFKDFNGTITEEGEDITKSKINVGIKTASINTDNEKRDATYARLTSSMPRNSRRSRSRVRRLRRDRRTTIESQAILRCTASQSWW